MNFLHNFKTGFCCALRGVAEFYRRPEYLVYMIVPLILLLALYGIAVWGARELYLWSSGFLPEPQDWYDGWRWLAVLIRWIWGITIFITSAVLMGICANSLFEAFGAVLFDSMVAKFELEKYGRPAERGNFSTEFELACVAAGFALVTLAIGFFAWLIGLFIPFCGWLLPSVATCRRIGCSYLWSSVLTHNALDRRDELFEADNCLVAGFGMACVIMLAIPVLAIIFIPGMVLGGAIVYNEHLDTVLEDVG